MSLSVKRLKLKKAVKKMTQEERKVAIGEYKGNAMLIIGPDNRFPFQFGMAKAKLILENLDAIRKFVETDGKEC